MASPWIFAVLLATLHTARSSKILTLMTVPSHSHHNWNKVYLEALATRGHEITYLAVDEYPNKPPNIRHILLENAYDLYIDLNLTKISGNSPYESIVELDEWEDLIAYSSVEQKGFQKFLDILKTEKFDLVVYDLGTTLFLLGAVDLIGRPPLIGITPFSIPQWALDYTGTPYPISNNMHMFYDGGKDMGFFERLENLIVHLFAAGYRSFVHSKNQDAVSQKAFGPGVRHIWEIVEDLNIAIVNGNWATDYPFPTAPGLIPVAGMHIAPVKPLPEGLKKFLDAASAGVIFFSMGSNIQSSGLSPKQIEVLKNAFAQLAPIKVLWKWESDTLPGKPDNVHVQKWLPQNDILAHPNVRLFFTHGGMLSTQEALYHGKPVVGMPVFLDQHVNIKKAIYRGFGTSLKLDSITTEKVVKTIRRVLDNPSYSQKALEMSKIFRDQQNSPLDTAIYWTEYAIRHKGASHLQPASVKQSWFQNGLYDFFLIVVAIISVILYIAFKIITFIVQFYLSSRSKSKND